jgi:hypothetical protein
MHHLNDDSFFLAAATVIPVLLLALTVQGDFLFTVVLQGRRQFQKVESGQRLSRGQRWTQVASGFFFATLISVVLVFRFFAELVAFNCLHGQQATPDETYFVLVTTLLLMASVIVGFMARVQELVNEVRVQIRRTRPMSARPIEHLLSSAFRPISAAS